jgi:hypothetical protein
MPDAFARLLQRMMAEGSVPRSQLSDRSLKDLRSLFDGGALNQVRSGGGLVVEVKNPETLAAFYRQRYPSDGKDVTGPPRARAVGMLRNAKRVGRTNMEPVLVRAINQLVCTRNETMVNLFEVTRQTGSACLILDQGRFWTMQATIAIVENLECFLHFERMGVAADLAVYSAGRLSELALQWLNSPEMSDCRFVHCGDFDPVGLDEFLRLKKAVGDRARLHIPPNLSNLVSKYGRSELLIDSEAILRRLRASVDPDVCEVIEILDETCCGLEQEALLMT